MSSKPFREARCTLSPEALADRVAELRSEFFPLVTSVRDTDDGCLLEFPREAGMIERLADFISFEAECCGFRSYALEVGSGHDHVDLRVSGPPGSTDAIRQALEVMSEPGVATSAGPVEELEPPSGGC